MDWIEHFREGPFVVFRAFQPEGRLSVQLASDGEIDEAVALLKRQIDQEARRMKMALQQKWEPFTDA